MQKRFLIIETDQTFIQKFQKNLDNQFLSPDFSILNIIPNTINGKLKMFNDCVEAISKISTDEIGAILIDINLSEEERDNTGIELGMEIRKQYPNMPIFAITSKSSSDNDLDTLSDATLEDFDGVLIKKYLIGNDFSAERLKIMLSKAAAKRIKKTNIYQSPIDVLVVSVVPKEFQALDLIFNLTDNNTRTATQIIDGIRFWTKKIKQNTTNKHELNVHFTMIGSAGNVLSGLFMNSVLSYYSPKVAILCGIAAGNSEKVKIYSAIIGNHVAYYELQKLRTNGELEYRIRPHSFPSVSTKDISYLVMRNKEWKEGFAKELEKIEIEKNDFIRKDWIDEHWLNSVVLKEGVIASGEKLIADGQTLTSLAKIINIDKATLAGEMEAAGFCEACHSAGVQEYLVFRGISDYGGVEKSDEINDKYQIIAALSAGTLLKEYLEYIYNPL